MIVPRTAVAFILCLLLAGLAWAIPPAEPLGRALARAELVVVGKLGQLTPIAGTTGATGEITVAQVLKGPADLKTVTLQTVAPGQQVDGPVIRREGDEGIWILNRHSAANGQMRYAAIGPSNLKPMTALDEVKRILKEQGTLAGAGPSSPPATAPAAGAAPARWWWVCLPMRNVIGSPVRSPATSRAEDLMRPLVRNEHVRTAPDKEPAVLRFVTLNMQMGFLDGQSPWDTGVVGARASTLDHWVEALTKAQPDAVALQEVPLDRPNTEVKDVLGYLAGKLKMNSAFASHGFDTPGKLKVEGKWIEHGKPYGQWGVALLSRYPMEKADHFVIGERSAPGARNFLKVRIRVGPGRTVTCYSVHFGPGKAEEGERRLEAFVAGISDHQGPAICMGDFNISPRDVAQRRIGSIYRDSYEVYRADRGMDKDPGRWRGLSAADHTTLQLFAWRIDYVMINRDVGAIQGIGLLDSASWYLSDHLGYYADVVLGQGRP